ncbi:MAG: hypothetical protein K9H49_13445 [Bacteroidales bacterium]|nr:hypothetical protein [Bacteroidales bacterium]MCF8391406.1 hypothetical protein [Bacteroidales bacterium]
MKKTFFISLMMSIGLNGFAQTSIDYFFNENYHFSSEIMNPDSFSGYNVGNWHFSYEQIAAYGRYISEKSDRAISYTYAKSWENRELLSIVFTSPDNHKNLDALLSNHKAAAFDRKISSEEKNPLIIRLGYGVHGNESSASNSSLLTMYFLAAANGDFIDKLLDECIIIVDPVLNPDGFTRHSTWVNSNRSSNLVADPQARGFNEDWPGARTNHYLFDMNRDYIPLINLESAGRVKEQHRWMPNIVTDHHEMGANSTFFFQPGVESRNNPLTPAKNYILTKEISQYHAKELDNVGSFYFSEETFDDYYFGKGSSYPDINSGVGILFEQAGLRGHLRETEHGLKSFSFAIRNQLSMTMSTLKAGLDLKSELLNYQKEFYSSALSEAATSPVKAYIFGEDSDKTRLSIFVELLQKHQIEVRSLTRETRINDIDFKPGSSFIIETHQKQFRLIKSFFDPVSYFEDTTFYDVSTWALPYSFNIKYAQLTNQKQLMDLAGETLTIPVENYGSITSKGDYALLMNWNEYYSPAVLNKFLAANIRAYSATQKFRIEGKNYDFGTIMIPLSDQKLTKDEIISLADKLAADYSVNFTRVSTGLSETGINLGSEGFRIIEKTKVAILSGEGSSSSMVGEAWYVLDQVFEMPSTLLDISNLSRADMSEYTTIILLARNPDFSEKSILKIKNWINNGGTLLAYGSGSEFLIQNELIEAEVIPTEEFDSSSDFSFAEKRKIGDIHRIAGSIFEIQADLSHPLFYGYQNEKIPVFKNSSLAVKKDAKLFVNPALYTSNPLLSGYSSKENVARIANSAYAIIQHAGAGQLIFITDNPNFRGMWYGNTKIFANAVFLGDLMR